MKLGLALPHYDTSYAGRPLAWENVKRAAECAESSGFDSVWVSDHLFLDWGKYGGPRDAQGSLECWTLMAAVAAATSRVRVGSLTSCNDFRHPGLVAKMAATLDVLARGRVEIGLGAGWYEDEYGAAGIDFDRPATRIKRLGEAVEIVRRLLDGEELVYSGRHYGLDGAICRPAPVGAARPRIWIGGKGDLLLDVAARAADGWNYSWIGSLETYRERSVAADGACERRGRDPASLARSVGAYVLTAENERGLRARFERLVDRTPAGVLQRIGDGSAVSWEAFRATRVAGTLEQVIDVLGRLSELGVEEVVVAPGALPFQVSDLDDVALIGTQVASAFRS